MSALQNACVLCGRVVIAWAGLLLTLTGCTSQSDQPSDSDVTAARLLSPHVVARPSLSSPLPDGFVAPSDFGSTHDAAGSFSAKVDPSQITAPTVVKRIGLDNSFDRHRAWSLERLHAEFASDRSDQLVQAIELIQKNGLPPLPEGADEDEAAEDAGVGGPAAAEDAGVGPSSSDLGPVEIIPTPRAQPEVKAEVIPTPLGIPERKMNGPITRIASEPEPAKGAPSQPANTPPNPKMTPGTVPVDDVDNEFGIAGLAGVKKEPDDYQTWEKPDVALFVTGNQHGYIEPCGCTGLDKQKGGVARRHTFMTQLRTKEWDLVPIDAGNQIRRIGQQAAIKFSWSSKALQVMKYEAVGFGPDDMRINPGDLIASALDSPEPIYVAGNLVLLDPSLIPSHKVVEKGKWKIGITTILDADELTAPLSPEVVLNDAEKSAKEVLGKLQSEGANFKVMTFFGSEEKAKKLAQQVPGYDLIIVSGGYGEPTYQPQPIENSTTQIILTGNKGMYVGLVSLRENKPFQYARVALTSEFEDSPEMRGIMKDYQRQLQDVGFADLGLKPIPHPSGEKFVGSEACGKCHTEAMAVWSGSAHFDATAHIVKPPEGRGDVPRHFDPECVSCHVTGWNPENYYPYETGYLSLENSKHLLGNGCENCHGPGGSHSAAEAEGSDVSLERKKELRMAMQLPLDKAKEHCMKCHDLDNSPDFHDEGAFEDEYWPEVEHYGVK
ncbi:multiheme c-type cytochrome [Stieleria varia]|uniref:Perchlorate reductase subunit gamma n=1 Tax=Stieleria varia TaxID=2528005 RepID=A0A5C6ARY4_9BACT|nr:multiheme c-type cytochrome [Stieleria varia]TWU02460.1 Perchlorate reductase subunit gamma precursor [Stieleria varia]